MLTYYVYGPVIYKTACCAHFMCIAVTDMICLYFILHVCLWHTMRTQHVFQPVLNSEIHSMQSYIMQCNVVLVVVQCMCVVDRLIGLIGQQVDLISWPLSLSQHEWTKKTLNVHNFKRLHFKLSKLFSFQSKTLHSSCSMLSLNHRMTLIPPKSWKFQHPAPPQIPSQSFS